VLGVGAEKIEIEWEGGVLLESTDLQQWSPVSETASSRTIRLPLQNQRFFRVAN
jgi:hypothetical protein